MFHPANIKVDKWTAENVASWVKGLDSAINPYHTNFYQHGIDGKRLLILDHHDLERIGLSKVGHQETLLASLELLLFVHNDLNTCNLQSLALVVTCRITYLRCILDQKDADTDSSYNRKLVGAVAFLIQSLKKMMNWLNSRPFTGMDEFVALHQQIGKTTLSILSAFSRSSRVQSIMKNKSQVLAKLAEIESKCEDLVKNGSNPIILTPASLESVVVRKRHVEEPLGLHLQSTQPGVHIIKLIRQNTACDGVSKLEPGDQIVQVNKQVVVAWQLSNVASALKEDPKEVSLIVMKSPRHFNLQSFNQRRPSPKNVLALTENIKQSTFPKRSSKHGSEDGSFDGKVKSCSISEAAVTTTHNVITEPIATPSSTTDEVFSLSPSSSDTSQISSYAQDGWSSATESSHVNKSIRPTILVNDVWDPEHSEADIAPPAAVTSTGKKEVLSTFHVVKSTPELRTPETDKPPTFPPS